MFILGANVISQSNFSFRVKGQTKRGRQAVGQKNMTKAGPHAIASLTSQESTTWDTNRVINKS